MAARLIISGVCYLIAAAGWHLGGHTILYLTPEGDHLFMLPRLAGGPHDVRNVYEAVLATLFDRNCSPTGGRTTGALPTWTRHLTRTDRRRRDQAARGRGHWRVNCCAADLRRDRLRRRVMQEPGHHAPPGFPGWAPSWPGSPGRPCYRHAGRPDPAPLRHRPGDTIQLDDVGRSADDQGRAGRRRAQPKLSAWPRWTWAAGHPGTGRLEHGHNLPVPDRPFTSRCAVRIVTVVLDPSRITIYIGAIRHRG